jgi:hypothetical protein
MAEGGSAKSPRVYPDLTVALRKAKRNEYFRIGVMAGLWRIDENGNAIWMHSPEDS